MKLLKPEPFIAQKKFKCFPVCPDQGLGYERQGDHAVFQVLRVQAEQAAAGGRTEESPVRPGECW